MVFEENDCSHVGKVDVCDADAEIPQDSIRRMGVGFFRPIEEPLVVDGKDNALHKYSPHLHKLNNIHMLEKPLHQHLYLLKIIHLLKLLEAPDQIFRVRPDYSALLHRMPEQNQRTRKK